MTEYDKMKMLSTPERKPKMQNKQNIQDTFLNQARREKTTVTVFLMNGFQLKGIVRGFDNFVVVLDTEGKQQMIYKHAISTIVPPKPIQLNGVSTEEEDA